MEHENRDGLLGVSHYDGTIPETHRPMVVSADEEIIELGNNFDFDGYQVVRREFFAHQSEPAITFNNCKFYVNRACLSKYADVQYVQVLVNKEQRILALRPCTEYARDAVMWCSDSGGKRKPKQITCRLFFAKVVSMMGWNPDFRYKILGKVIHANNEYLFAFDLAATEVYQKTVIEGGKPKTSRTPMYPSHWQNQFGLPYSEHKQSLKVNTFEGYSVYALRDNTVLEASANNQNSDLGGRHE